MNGLTKTLILFQALATPETVYLVPNRPVIPNLDGSKTHGLTLGLSSPLFIAPGAFYLYTFTRKTSVPNHIKTFLLTSETTAEGIIAHYRRTLTNMIQIVDAVDLGV